MTNRNPVYTVSTYSESFGLDMPKDSLVFCLQDNTLWIVTEDSDLSDNLNGVTKSQLNPNNSKQVGELFYLDDYIPVSSSFPAYCLNQDTSTISSTNYPSLVTFLRSKKITHNLTTSTWNVTSWDITSNVATLTLAKNSNFTGTVSASDSSTLTFSNSQSFSVNDILLLSNGSFVKILSGSGTSWNIDIAITISSGTGRVLTKEELLLRSLAEDLIINGSYSNWRTVTLANQIGDIVAGDYAITDINTTNNTVKFAYSATNNSGSGSYTIEFYLNRVVGSSTTARIFKNQARTLYTVDSIDYLAGLRKRNTMQGHWHSILNGYGSQLVDDSGGSDTGHAIGVSSNNNYKYIAKTIIPDGINDTTRTWKNTSADAYAAYLYIWAGQYNP